MPWPRIQFVEAQHVCLRISIFRCSFYDAQAEQQVLPREETELKRKIFEVPRRLKCQQSIEEALGAREPSSPPGWLSETELEVEYAWLSRGFPVYIGDGKLLRVSLREDKSHWSSGIHVRALYRVTHASFTGEEIRKVKTLEFGGDCAAGLCVERPWLVPLAREQVVLDEPDRYEVLVNKDWLPCVVRAAAEEFVVVPRRVSRSRR